MQNKISNTLIAALLSLFLFAPPSPAQKLEKTTAAPKPTLDYRWFFSFGNGRNPDGVQQIKALIDTAAAHHLNGMVLSSFGLDGVTRWDTADIALLRQVVQHAAAKDVEWIPTGFSAGYGGGALGHDRSFAAALPTTLDLKAENGKIVPAPSANLLINGDLEQHADTAFAGYEFTDQPGVISFADTQAMSGMLSVRFENFTASPHGHGRLAQKISLRPGRAYRFSLKMKTRDLKPVSGLKLMVYDGERSLAERRPQITSTQDWTEVTLDYINTTAKEVYLYAGIWGGQSGTFWLDDLNLVESASLADIPRRQGTPIELRSRDRDAVFVEGKDFAALQCLRELAHVDLLPGSAIRPGEQLELSCYKIPYIAHSWGKQTSLCMSHEPLYAYWEEQARRLYEIAPYQKFLLEMDEIRNGGGCLLCQKRGIPMAQILGECITRQREIFKKNRSRYRSADLVRHDRSSPQRPRQLLRRRGRL